MNIGAGSAATALSQMLGCKVELEIPKVLALAHADLIPILQDPSRPVTGVRMRLLGDIVGEAFFIVPEEHQIHLIQLAESASGVPSEASPHTQIRDPHSESLSALAELGNIMVGVYLTAIHDFCQLNIYHSVPTLAIDMAGSLVDEALSAATRQVQTLLVENRFNLAEEQVIRTFLLIIPAGPSVRVLADSIEQAKRLLAEG